MKFAEGSLMLQLGLETGLSQILAHSFFSHIMLPLSSPHIHDSLCLSRLPSILICEERREGGTDGGKEKREGGREGGKKGREVEERNHLHIAFYFFMALVCFLPSINDPYRGLRILLSPFLMVNLLLLPL